MRKFLLLIALAGAGCSSMTQIAKVSSSVKTDDGATPVAGVTVQNVSYRLFGCLPISSGVTWQGECAYESRPGRNTVWFEDRCSPDENLASLKAALKVVGSNKVMNLTERTETWSAWSLWLVRQTLETTSCTVLK